MFVDYYAVLELDIAATLEEIKVAFKKQALRWHPDRNPEYDANFRMQQINEAYLILKDPEVRERYDIEYKQFKQYQQQAAHSEKERKHSEEQQRRENVNQQYKKQYEYKEYTVNDDILDKWMENARKQAVDLAKKTIEEFKGISSAGAKAIANEAASGIGRYIIFSLIIFVIFALIRSCNG